MASVADGWWSGIPVALPTLQPGSLHVPDDLPRPPPGHSKVPIPMPGQPWHDDEDESDDGEPYEPLPTAGSIKRRYREQMEREEVRSFLSRHGFADVNTLRRRRSGYLHFSCLFGEEEEFYPIHVAVKTGNVKMIRLLLQVGAKKEQETSRGRTAWEIAQDCIRCKHNAAQMEGILQILEGKMKTTWSASDLLRATHTVNPANG
ncbi:Serine/threonine-protein phosphatase PP2A 65 kDa regulatory subunit [Durusdinium trenchii]|uniref:Serine/threonine-protein phosphatase PP2A 65 kDa regulatory subunit n=1 Tax=Durusdinium trenchii TaxID=1381693 RepID=A0ABP0KY15_9DINO